MQLVYFDNNSTTLVDPEVRAAMVPFLTDYFGNPSSNHRLGAQARNAVEQARQQVASLLGTQPERIVFNSGGSEGNNAVLFSAAISRPEKKHLISSQVEHASVLEPLRFLETMGYEVEFLPVAANGNLDLARLAGAIRPDTALVSLMAANNETGVLWPLEKIAAICREKKVLFHSDAVQLAGKLPIKVEELGLDYLTVSAHKLHGPKGVGALYVGRTAPFHSSVLGAGQENGRRAGTENVPAIAGFGRACELAADALAAGTYQRVGELRDRLQRELRDTVADLLVNGEGMPRLPNTLNLSFKHCSSAGLIQDLDSVGLLVSAHSACQSGDLDPSHVLRAMGVTEPYLHGTLRISLSRCSTEAEVERFLAVLPGLVSKSRKDFAW
jgi:cysteine desulfurase